MKQGSSSYNKPFITLSRVSVSKGQIKTIPHALTVSRGPVGKVSHGVTMSLLPLGNTVHVYSPSSLGLWLEI